MPDTQVIERTLCSEKEPVAKRDIEQSDTENMGLPESCNSCKGRGICRQACKYLQKKDKNRQSDPQIR
jgi:radical SAM protein with 4Fe4S-binding SPASM domain